ncbi:MAG: hypothetical protein QXM25_04485, partial [Nitrososphaerales archaeon]
KRLIVLRQEYCLQISFQFHLIFFHSIKIRNWKKTSGESLEKSGFQTIRDSFEISSKYDKQILFPLIGLSRKEIINYSKRIGIFRFTKGLEKVTTEPNRRAIIEAERKLEIERIVEEALSKVVLIDLKRGFDDVHNILNHYSSQKLK